MIEEQADGLLRLLQRLVEGVWDGADEQTIGENQLARIATALEAIAGTLKWIDLHLTDLVKGQK